MFPRRRVYLGTCCVFALTLLAIVTAPAADRQPPELKNLGRSHKVRLIYLVPKDREPTPHYADKIRTVMTFAADLYREDARRRGLAGHELDFHFEDGKPQVIFHRSELTNADFDNTELNSGKQWPLISREVSQVFGSPGEQLFVVFAETYGPGPAQYEWPGGIALGARYSANGGLGIFSGWILRDEFCATNAAAQVALLADVTPIEGRTALGHGRLNSPRFEFIEDGFGAVAHELGHALGLPHDLRNDDQFIMGNGFRNLRRNYLAAEPAKPPVGFSDENSRLLRWSRFLNPRFDAGDSQVPDANLEFITPPAAGGQQLHVRLKASDDGELGAVVFHFRGQNSVVGGGELDGKSVEKEFTLKVRPLKSGMQFLQANVIDRSGNISTVAAQALVP